MLTELQLPEVPLYQPAWPLMEPRLALSYVTLDGETPSVRAETAMQALGPPEPPSQPASTFRHSTSRDYHQAYQSGAAPPTLWVVI